MQARIMEKRIGQPNSSVQIAMVFCHKVKRLSKFLNLYFYVVKKLNQTIYRFFFLELQNQFIKQALRSFFQICTQTGMWSGSLNRRTSDSR